MAKEKKQKDKKQKKKVNKLEQELAVTITPENKCSFCVGSKCCNHISQEIDAPTSMADFDQLLWQVSHPQIEIYKDDDGWFLLVANVACSHLQPTGACGIYEKRPMICREYSNDHCEFDASAEDDFDLYFPDYESLDKYCRKKYKNWDKRFKKWAKQA